MGIVRFSDNISDAATYRSQLVWEEALRRNIRMQQLIFFGVPSETYRAKIADKWFYFQSLPMRNKKLYAASGWVDDKFLLKQTLRAHGVPVPEAISVRTLVQARKAFEQIKKPVIVKPRSGSRGRHTTTNISLIADFESAFVRARQLCLYVNVEEHISGNVCRATILNGKLVGFFEAEIPWVCGDGHSTIKELVVKKNNVRHERVKEIDLSEEHLSFLSRSELNIESIPKAGEKIELTHRTGRLFGGETCELLDDVHPKLKKYVEKASQVIGTKIVGFDLIIPDPRQDPDAQRWGIIEANTLPFIDLHYLPLRGRPSNIAGVIWDEWNM